MLFAPRRRAIFLTSAHQKVVRTLHAFNLSTCKCASCHCVQLSHIPTSKRGPNMVCFVHFDLQLHFSPQWSAIFPHQNFQKWSEAGVFCAFWLRNVLRTTAACHFLTSELLKVVREWCVLRILTTNVLRATAACNFPTSQLPKVVRERCFFLHFDFKICFVYPPYFVPIRFLSKKWAWVLSFCRDHSRIVELQNEYTFFHSLIL